MRPFALPPDRIMSHFTERDFRNAMGQFCTGVVVVTGIANGEPLGFSAQSFVSLSLDPPLIGVAPALTSTTWPRLRGSGRFGINILGADQRAICASFARSGGDKFSGLRWTGGAHGAPLIEGVIGFVECTLEAEHATGDHTLVVGRVLDLRVLDTVRLPLLFFRGRYGSFGDLSA